MKSLLLVLALTLLPQAASQDVRKMLDGFTLSPSEHSIDLWDMPFEVASVQGVALNPGGLEPELPSLLFEIRGPGNSKKIRRATTKDDGRFKIDAVPPGTYTFKATCYGFGSIVGTIVVSKSAPKSNAIKLLMHVDN